jgi:hypothetical protein
LGPEIKWRRADPFSFRTSIRLLDETEEDFLRTDITEEEEVGLEALEADINDDDEEEV